MRWWSTVVIAAVLALQVRPAFADGNAPDVAVFPLSTAEDSMAIYSKAVADAVARKLRSRSKLRVRSVLYSDTLPVAVALIVTGRIVSVDAKTVRLEAKVRDPEIGADATAHIATSAKPLARIDELAEELAVALAPRITHSVAAVRMRRADDAKARTTVTVRAEPGPTAHPHKLAATPAARRDTRPGILVFQADGKVANGAIPVSPIVTRHAYWIAERLGRRPVPSAERGIVSRQIAVRELARTGLDHALMVHVRAIHFGWEGVLTARGRVRVVMVDKAGAVLFDETARTDTVVGSRGDRHAALVHFVAEQAVDILVPHLKRALAR